jgi:hypothetical protein
MRNAELQRESTGGWVFRRAGEPIDGLEQFLLASITPLRVNSTQPPQETTSTSDARFSELEHVVSLCRPEKAGKKTYVETTPL